MDTNKEFARWELGIDQDCPECKGWGEHIISVETYGPNVRHSTCSSCGGSGYKYRHPNDGLRVMRSQRRQWAASRFAGYMDDYRKARAATTRRTLGWAVYRMNEAAIRMGAASESAVAAWRANA